GTLWSCLPLVFCARRAPSETDTLSLHDALPICQLTRGSAIGAAHERLRRTRGHRRVDRASYAREVSVVDNQAGVAGHHVPARHPDRKSTRLNSSHVKISYAVFCLKKKKKKTHAH